MRTRKRLVVDPPRVGEGARGAEHVVLFNPDGTPYSPGSDGNSSFVGVAESVEDQTLTIDEWVEITPTGWIYQYGSAPDKAAIEQWVAAEVASRYIRRMDGTETWGDGENEHDMAQWRDSSGGLRLGRPTGEGIQVYGYEDGAGFVIDNTTHNWSFDMNGDNPNLDIYYDGLMRGGFTHDGTFFLTSNGAAIQLKSPDGTTHNLTVTDDHTLEVVSV